MSRTPPRNGDSGLCISPGSLKGPPLAKARRDLRHGAQKEDCHDRSFAVRGQTDLRPLVRTPCASTLRQQVRGVINHQGGLVSKRLCTLANNLLVWAQTNQHSLKAMPVPGKMNQGADMLSRNNVFSEEWMLHPLAVQKIW